MGTVNVGHTDTMTIQQLDQNGNPMLTPVPFATPPVWANAPSAPGVDSFVAAADGSSAVLTALSAGTDTVTVTASAVVNGNTVSFSATDLVTIAAAPQVLSSIAIVENIQ
jgi:hypothetical protein